MTGDVAPQNTHKVSVFPHGLLFYFHFCFVFGFFKPDCDDVTFQQMFHVPHTEHGEELHLVRAPATFSGLVDLLKSQTFNLNTVCGPRATDTLTLWHVFLTLASLTAWASSTFSVSSLPACRVENTKRKKLISFIIISYFKRVYLNQCLCQCSPQS